MLAIVARSATLSEALAGPQNSTKSPVTRTARSRCVTVSTRSVTVTPGESAPTSRTPITRGTVVI